MKRSIVAVALTLGLAGTALAQRGAPPPPATGPIADLTNAIVDAYNRQDMGYFDRVMTADVLWLDEDGHFIGDPRRFLGRQLLGDLDRTLAISNLRVVEFGDAAWAAFSYVITDNGGSNPERRGTNSIVFRREGGEWKAALIHGAINAPALAPH